MCWRSRLWRRVRLGPAALVGAGQMRRLRGRRRYGRGGAATSRWDEDEMFALVERAYPYRNLKRETFDSILEMLSEGIAARRGRYGAYMHRDRVNGKLRARRGARLAAITSGGAIPDNSLYTVVAEPDGVVVGTVDEDFAVESNRGDIMLLGNTSWMIHRIETNAGRMLVQDAHGAPPSVPFWRGEAPARTQELSAHVGELRREDQRDAAAHFAGGIFGDAAGSGRGSCVAEGRVRAG